MGFDIKYGDIIEIDVNLLPKESSIRIDVKCDICEKQRNLAYRDYRFCFDNQKIYCCVKCSKIKKEKTNLNKFGFSYPLKNKEILKKQQNTCLERYGFDTNLKCEDTKNKIKETCLKKYGVDNYSKTDESKRKAKNTCIEKYNVDSPMQNSEIFKKSLISAYKLKKYKDILYQGTYELDFLINFYDKLKIINSPTLKYEYDEKIKIYHPDFYLPEYNLIVEIKSNYIYELHKEQNEYKKIGSLKNGYNFIFVIDKNYTDLYKILHLDSRFF